MTARRKPNEKNSTRKPAAKPSSGSGAIPPVKLPPEELRPNCFSATTTTKTRRIFYIATRMAANQWPRKGGKHYKELAELWQLSESSIKDMACDAGRLLELIGHRSELVQVGRMRLLEIMGENGSDRVAAIRTLFENLGELSSRKKVELGGDIGVEGARLVFLPEEDDEPETAAPDGTTG